MINKKVTHLAIMLGVGVSISTQAAVKGQWDFNSGDLSATTGAPLTLLGAPTTTFATMTIAGNPAKVMGFPACASVTEGYVMTHGIAPNGGLDANGDSATNVNQYTLIFDIMFPATSTGQWRTFLQTDLSNTSDATLFANTGNGIGNYGNYGGTLLANTWHRVAFVVDLSTNAMVTGSNLWKYIDGQLVGVQGNPVGGLKLDQSFSLKPTALLFADNDGDTRAGFVNSIQIRDTCLTATDIQNLGTPTATGIPAVIPSGPVSVTVSPATRTDVVGMTSQPFNAIASLGTAPFTYQWYHNGVALAGQTNTRPLLTYLQSSDAGNYAVVVTDAAFHSVTSTPPNVLTVNPAPPTQVTGQWDFNQGNLAATLGAPMQCFDLDVQAETSFDTTTALSIPDIAGQPAKVMFWNPVFSGGGYFMTNGIAPNGGGTNVNQYTVIIDLMYPFVSWASLWQTDPTNSSDADVFIRPGGGIGISSSYSGSLTLGEWHRVVLAFDENLSELGKYIDGTNTIVGAGSLHQAQSVGGVDGRFSLGPVNLLLADNDFEILPVYVSSVQIRSGRMTDAAIAAMGAPTANKIPGSIKASTSGGSVVIAWTGNVLDSAPTPDGPWSVVSGAAHPHLVTSPAGSQFFRVRQ